MKSRQQSSFTMSMAGIVTAIIGIHLLDLIYTVQLKGITFSYPMLMYGGACTLIFVGFGLTAKELLSTKYKEVSRRKKIEHVFNSTPN